MAVLKYKNPTTGWEQVPMYGVIGRDVPTGTICSFAGSSEPTGYLFCDGRSLSKTEYPELFNVIGETYGSVDNDHFNLPNIQERVIIGMSGTSPYDKLGNKGGEKEHTLTIEEMPSHHHLIERQQWYGNDTVLNSGTGTIYSWKSGTGGTTSASYYNNKRQDTNKIDYTGGSQAHNNMQPYIVLNYIIKAFKTAGVIAQVEDTLTSSSRSDALSAKQGMVLNQRIEAIEEEGVGDSLPIGSIINYDGNDIPEGWESIANPNYSTEETMTGQTWIDGRHIYRKVIKCNLSNSENRYYIDHNITNFKELISYRGTIYYEGGYRPIPEIYPPADDKRYDLTLYTVGASNILLAYGDWVRNSIGALTNYPVTIILEYTKTTD